MSQKVQFIAAVVPEPKLLILDEPFSGLDPVSADLIRTTVLELRRHGATVILSTHDMSVAESMCDYIFMIFKGKKVLDGTLASIQDRYGSDTIRVSTERRISVRPRSSRRGEDSRLGAIAGAAHGAGLRPPAGAPGPGFANLRNQLLHREAVLARYLRAHRGPAAAEEEHAA